MSNIWKVLTQDGAMDSPELWGPPCAKIWNVSVDIQLPWSNTDPDFYDWTTSLLHGIFYASCQQRV